MTERVPVTTTAELDSLDSAEIVEGYLDGLADPDNEPGDNRSKSYWHGWRNGSLDRSGRPDPAALALAKAAEAASPFPS
jgi:hypothetical protein